MLNYVLFQCMHLNHPVVCAYNHAVNILSHHPKKKKIKVNVENPFYD